MRHLTADSVALVLGVVVGVGAGLYARRETGRAVAITNEIDSGASYVPPLYVLVSFGATAGLLVGSRFGTTAELPAFLYLVAIAPALGAIDAVTRRLPNFIVLPSYPLAVLLLGIAAWYSNDPAAFWRSLLAGAVVYVFLLAVALATPPRSLGWADVKLGGLLGLFLGYLGWGTALLGMVTAWGFATVYVVVRAVDRGRRGQPVPLGPALLIGALLAVIVS